MILLDIDGTLAFGGRPLPGAGELLDLLNKEGFLFLLMTNDCCSSHEQKAAILPRGGLPVSAEHVFSCGDVLRLWKKQSNYAGELYFLSVYESLKAELAERFQKEIAPERIAMVGDSLASDIRGAKANGLLSCLVLSGITTQELAAAAPADRKPDLIFSGV